jgi:hypothetical protein
MIHAPGRLSLFLGVLAACGPGGRERPDDGGPGGDGGDGFIDASPVPDGGGCALSCSADLKDVVDCQGNVVESCADDQGCGAAGCVPACQAAQENKSSIGCEYYVISPDTIGEGAGGCLAAFVANVWDAPVTITAEYGGMALDVSAMARVPTGSGPALTYQPLPGGVLGPGEVAAVFLAYHNAGFLPPCPAGVTPGVTGFDVATHGTAYGSAFRLTTSAPVVAYDIYPFGGGSAAATSATLLLPVSAWDTNYVGVDAYAASVAAPGAVPWMTLVGMEDGTQVTILPKVAIEGGAGVPGGPANTPVMYTLGRGQTLELAQAQELIGSPIQSTKPVGLFAGASCLNVPVDAFACDSAHQQIPPVGALGHQYAAVRYRNRFDGMEETVPWRLVGAVDGTTLTYSPATPPGAPTTLAKGQLVEFQAPGPFVVSSQDVDHPFYMAAYMTGCEHIAAVGNCRGDPEFVNVIPTQQYLARYAFFTDPTYPETNLVLVRQAQGGVFADVMLDCHGVVTGWQPLDATGTFQYARVDLVRGNFGPQGSCDNGLHDITSSQPFGLTVWGWGSELTQQFTQAVSYAYPAGASVRKINTVVVPPIP